MLQSGVKWIPFWEDATAIHNTKYKKADINPPVAGHVAG